MLHLAVKRRRHNAENTGSTCRQNGTLPLSESYQWADRYEKTDVGPSYDIWVTSASMTIWLNVVGSLLPVVSTTISSAAGRFTES